MKGIGWSSCMHTLIVKHYIIDAKASVQNQWWNFQVYKCSRKHKNFVDF